MTGNLKLTGKIGTRFLEVFFFAKPDDGQELDCFLGGRCSTSMFKV